MPRESNIERKIKRAPLAPESDTSRAAQVALNMAVHIERPDRDAVGTKRKMWHPLVTTRTTFPRCTSYSWKT